jgi:hypothetical protein
VTGARRVAARVTALCLDDVGRLRADRHLATAVRGGLLVDLALSGRLELTEEDVVLDRTPLGWGPADRALADLGALDGRSLDWWLAHSRLGPADVAAALVDDGSWEPVGRHGRPLRPRFAERDPAPGLHDLAVLGGECPPETVEEAAVLCLVDASGVPHLREPGTTAEDVLARTGQVRWVCEVVADHIRGARAAEGAAVRSATSGPPWMPPVGQ